ncbi:Uric acid transporter UacT [Paraburkholderia caffeinitolerans]|uniref:Uric acid transporter UacT n=1 Tax=Paraburkholderia caffeinitolerans TaxID=1723730 RepID=A0A6J5GV28_9BURK|nr:nucleobase:cation symporter-2 family protein [Paraburkholderia caffeinitolerans]CAB3807421.1 Uric acid transporter UacT [Paraburkholderia caffeinitolerans]
MSAELDSVRREIAPVDSVPKPPLLVMLGLQHVLVMYIGAVAVPMIIASALKLPKESIAVLINADLFTCGIATILQSGGIWRFGVRMPVMQGVAFSAVPPILVIATAPGLGLTAVIGAVMAGGVITMLLSPVFGRLVKFFPPIVGGSIVMVVGLSLFPVGVNWIGGGKGSPDFGAPQNLALAAFVFVMILAINRWLKGFWSNVSVLLALAIGMIVAIPLGMVNFHGVAEAPLVDMIQPFYFGMPIFDPIAVATIVVVMVIVMIESMGLFIATGDVVDKKLTSADMTSGLRANGLASVIGGIFNGFPYTIYSQNIGLLVVTGVKSRWVAVAAGVILCLLGLLPKLATIVASVPLPALGGAALFMFGVVTSTGVKTLSRVDFETSRRNVYIVSATLAVSLLPTFSPALFAKLPGAIQPILHSSILLACVTSVGLNLLFNGIPKGDPHAHSEQDPSLVLAKH